MQENYGTSLIDHAGTGEWDKRSHKRTLGHDGDFVHGMFQEPVINCDGNFNQGHEFPHFATNGTIPPAWLRSMLWLGAVTANMVNQLVFVLGPATPFELTDVMSAWAAEELELMPSLYGTFGQRDSVLATVASATPASPNRDRNTLVASADARMLTRLLPRSSAPIRRSRLAISRLTTRARQ